MVQTQRALPTGKIRVGVGGGRVFQDDSIGWRDADLASDKSLDLLFNTNFCSHFFMLLMRLKS
jgi:hypothetical protein